VERGGGPRERSSGVRGVSAPPMRCRPPTSPSLSLTHTQAHTHLVPLVQQGPHPGGGRLRQLDSRPARRAEGGGRRGRRGGRRRRSGRRAAGCGGGRGRGSRSPGGGGQDRDQEGPHGFEEADRAAPSRGACSFPKWRCDLLSGGGVASPALSLLHTLLPLPSPSSPTHALSSECARSLPPSPSVCESAPRLLGASSSSPPPRLPQQCSALPLLLPPPPRPPPPGRAPVWRSARPWRSLPHAWRAPARCGRARTRRPPCTRPAPAQACVRPR